MQTSQDLNNNQPEYEEFYDREIAPLLGEIIKKCEQHGLPFVAVCQYGESPDHYASFTNLHEPLHQGNNCSVGIDIINYLAKTQTNLDGMAIALQQRFKGDSLGSILLWRFFNFNDDGRKRRNFS